MLFLSSLAMSFFSPRLKSKEGISSKIPHVGTDKEIEICEDQLC